MISIVIPTKNNGDVLEQCLGSIEGLDVMLAWRRFRAGVPTSDGVGFIYDGLENGWHIS